MLLAAGDDDHDDDDNVKVEHLEVTLTCFISPLLLLALQIQIIAQGCLILPLQDDISQGGGGVKVHGALPASAVLPKDCLIDSNQDQAHPSPHPPLPVRTKCLTVCERLLLPFIIILMIFSFSPPPPSAHLPPDMALRAAPCCH